MKIKTTGEALSDELVFSSLFSQRAQDQAVKEFERHGKMEVKVAPDGRPVHRTALKALRVVDGVPIGEERNVSFAIIQPTDVVAGKIYRAVGAIWITPYENNGRVALSIIAEKVVVEQPSVPKPSIGNLA